jgi:hypothetical protein
VQHLARYFCWNFRRGKREHTRTRFKPGKSFG